MPNDQMCDDSDPCTDDTCDPINGCAHVPRGGCEPPPDSLEPESPGDDDEEKDEGV